MEKTNPQNNDLDNLFKENLSDFQVPIPGKFEQSDPSDLDKAFQDKLEAFESTPDEKNWTEIKKRIPLSLQMQRHLNFWSKVAAVLVVGLVSSLLFSNYQGHQERMAKEPVVLPEPEPVTPINLDDNVFDFNTVDIADKGTEDDDGLARDMFNQEEEYYGYEHEPTQALPPLEDKSLKPIVNPENPLDERRNRDVALGVPKQDDKIEDVEEGVSLVAKGVKEKSEEKNKQ